MPSVALNIRRRALNWLLTAIRPWLFQGRNAAQQLPRDDVDWKAIGDLAYFHNVEPLLYWMESNNALSVKIPRWLKQRWEQAYFGNFLRNENYLEILRILLGKCEKEGISIIVLKGPALIGRIYKDPALRTLSDLDILCSREDLQRIVKISQDIGYVMMLDGNGPRALHHLSMHQVSSEGPILEFHFMPFEVIRNHGKFMRSAWDRKEWVDIGDLHCPVLCLEMEILFNTAHLVHHQFDASLKHYLDIAGLLLFYEDRLNRDDFRTLLRDFGLEQAFAHTAGFLSTAFRLPRIIQVYRLNSPNSAQQKFDDSLRDLLALLDEERILDVQGIIGSFRAAIKENRERSGNKTVYMMKTLFPFFRDLASDHGDQSSGDAFRYFPRQLSFYGILLLLTLRHSPEGLFSNRPRSPAVERADAKGRIVRQFPGIARSK